MPKVVPPRAPGQVPSCAIDPKASNSSPSRQLHLNPSPIPASLPSSKACLRKLSPKTKTHTNCQGSRLTSRPSDSHFGVYLSRNCHYSCSNRKWTPHNIGNMKAGSAVRRSHTPCKLFSITILRNRFHVIAHLLLHLKKNVRHTKVVQKYLYKVRIKHYIIISGIRNLYTDAKEKWACRVSALSGISILDVYSSECNQRADLPKNFNF